MIMPCISSFLNHIKIPLHPHATICEKDRTLKISYNPQNNKNMKKQVRHVCLRMMKLKVYDFRLKFKTLTTSM
jgi:hypothetical protein